MAFDKTAARGSSRTRSAVWKVRLEMPLLLPPPFRGFLESAHPATPCIRRELGRRIGVWCHLPEDHRALVALGLWRRAAHSAASMS